MSNLRRIDFAPAQRRRAAHAQLDPHFMAPVAVQLWSETAKAFVVVMHNRTGKVFLPKSRVVQDEVHRHIFLVPNWLIWKEGLAPHPYR